MPTKPHPSIQAYNQELKPTDLQICDLLAEIICRCLPEAENKIWHAHPVWFIDGNPIVGYSKLKSCVRLLFWSGQSFEEAALLPEGSFKAAELRFTKLEELSIPDLERLLAKARAIQWDYKNLIKRKGVLERLR